MREEIYPFVVKPLPYEYDALTPILDANALTFHHDRHYKNYVDQLNEVLADYPQLQKMTLKELLTGLEDIPEGAKTPARNNGGGVYNHELYFDGMRGIAENARSFMTSAEPSGALQEALVRDFGSIKQWKDKMTVAALRQFGSGWAWLLADKRGILTIQKTANQDVPDLENYTPILALDVWEHAYYLQYQNRRNDYVEGWFDLINWKKAEKRYEEYGKNISF